MRVTGMHHVLGQRRDREEEEVPGLAELARMVQSLLKPPWMGRVENGKSVDHLGMIHRDRPGDASAPVVTDQPGGLSTELPDEALDVGGQQVDAVILEAIRLRRKVVAPRVGGDYTKARL